VKSVRTLVAFFRSESGFWINKSAVKVLSDSRWVGNSHSSLPGKPMRIHYTLETKLGDLLPSFSLSTAMSTTEFRSRTGRASTITLQIGFSIECHAISLLLRYGFRTQDHIGHPQTCTVPRLTLTLTSSKDISPCAQKPV